MALTPAQLATLKADILASPDLSSFPSTTDGAFAIALAYNQPAAPDWWVWKSSVSEAAIFADASFDWTRVDNLSVGKARIWEWMFRNNVVNPSMANIQAGIAAVWVGTSADLAVRAAVLGQCRRLATRGEKLFSTGTGTTASPATTSLAGPITGQDVDAARNLP